MEPQWKHFWNEKFETLSTDELLNLHQKKFLKQLEYVFGYSRFYQEKFKKSGLVLTEFRGLEDSSKLPFTEKEELRDAQTSYPPVGIHRACSIEKLTRVYSSSGTTGIPTYIGLTANDISNVHAEQ